MLFELGVKLAFTQKLYRERELTNYHRNNLVQLANYLWAECNGNIVVTLWGYFDRFMRECKINTIFKIYFYHFG